MFTYIVDSDSAVIGSEHVFPKLINSYNKAVTYSSSAPDIATIDESGNITLVAPGTTTITAQTTTDDGQTLSASYLLVVRKPTNNITFDSPVGTYVAAPVFVSLSASVDGTTFYYTTDGSDPTTESPLYAEAIEVTHSGTELKVLALNDETEDAMVSATYVIQPEKPLFDKEAQRFVKTLDVGLSLPESTPSTSKIYYAINEQADATKTLYEGTPVTLVGSSASQKIALHAVVVDEFGNVGVENSVEYTHETAVYKKVTSQEEIVDGGEYLVVCEEKSRAMGTTISSNHMSSVSVPITDNLIFSSQNIAVTLEKRSDGVFYLRLANGKYLASVTSSPATALQVLGSVSTSNERLATWNIVVNSADTIAVIENVNNSRQLMMSQTASLDFRTYTDIARGYPVQLYKKVTVPSSLSLRAKGDDSNYYATFSSTEDVVFDNDVTVSTVSVANGTLQVKPLGKGTYSVSSLDKMQVVDGYYVPANTGVLLTTPFTSTTCYAPLAKQNVTVDDTNLLVAVSEDGVFTGKEGYKYYKLAYDDSVNRTGLGFFWGADDGAPFKVVAGLAYLAVPNAVAASVKSGLQFPDPAGVVVVKAPEADGKIYTLSGQQIDKIKGRGVYIINGKKVVRR
ncbi:MAG: chitobiase/beta-hexosaminidase C-terminal domain-containing protein [Prevotella sp.]